MKSKKKKNIQKKIHCPCCKKMIELKNLKQLNSILPFDGFIKYDNSSRLESFVTTVSKYSDFYQWACDVCIKGGKAILANPKSQFYTFRFPFDTANPNLAYFDKSYTCKKCSVEFLFSKEEQKYWYEELSFIVHSKPTACKKCRKEIRQAKELNTELSTLLKNGPSKDKEVVLRIAEIYKEMGNVEKMKKYIKAGNKLS